MICARIQGGGYLVTSTEPFCDYYLVEKTDNTESFLPPLTVTEGAQLAAPIAAILVIVGLIKRISISC